jgi:hypothetical protein
MTRPLVIDAFPFHDELDILECRLYELERAVDWFVIVEADVTHQDRPKPWYLAENADRFKPWADKIVNVQASELPTAKDNADPWAREHAQREHIATGLSIIGVGANDIVLQSDVDEIPRALQARNVRPQGLLAFEQRLHCFAVDWLHPEPWRGTVAGTGTSIKALGLMPFGRMRDSRNVAPCPPALRNAGWHLSWLGGRDRALHKLGAFCHPEIARETYEGLREDRYLRNGWHVDGKRMAPYEGDDWPKWIKERRCPESWFRPRDDQPEWAAPQVKPRVPPPPEDYHQ